MNKETEIKPCPFCGGKPWITTGYEHHFIGGWTNELKLECCVTMTHWFGEYGETVTKEEARKNLIEQWNKRTNV